MKWRYYATSEFPRVVRDLGLPCATPVRVTGMTSCPRHQERLGKTSRVCIRCHHEAWDEVGRRYTSAEQRRTGTPAGRGPRDSDRPPPQAFPGLKHKPYSGQRPPFEEPTHPKEVFMSRIEVVEGELLPDVYDPVEDTPRAAITLFGTSDPKVALERMSDVASVLVDVIKDRKLFARISGHDHITAEGWTTLGGMLGIVPVVVWTKPNETGDGYLARVEARTLDGRIVGAAESECSRTERKWKSADPYAIRSMAQTRAIGRALRAPLGQIVVLAGYEATPAEEFPTTDETRQEPVAEPSPVPSAPSEEQKERISTLIGELQSRDEELGQESRDWGSWCRDYAGVDSFNDLSEAGAAKLVNGLERVLAQRSEPGVAA